MNGAAIELGSAGAAAGEGRRRVVMQVTWSLVAGGSEIYALTVASSLDRKHYASLMCGMDQGGALEEEIDRLGIGRFVMHRRPGIDWRVMWRMYRLMRQQHVDVIHTHHFNQLFYCVLAARLAGVRIVHTEHDVSQFHKPRLCWALRLMAMACHRVVAVGVEVARVLHEQVGIPLHRLDIIRAGVKTDAFEQSPAESRAQLGLNPSDRVVTIVARLSEEKNHRLLLAAFAQVAQCVPDAKLLIVGGGDQAEAIEREIDRLNLTERVRMLGVRRDVARILAATDVFVLTSDREGLPIVVLEAMAASRPVVATWVGDLPRVVQDGVTGRLVPPGDADAVASALIELLNDPPLAGRMGVAGQALAERDYSQRTMVEQYAALYGRS